SGTGAQDSADVLRPAVGGAPAPVAGTDGDFELARPAAPATDADGDYALSDPQSPGPEQSVPTVGGRDGTSHAPAVPGPSGEPAGPAMADVSGPGPEQSVPTQG